MDTARGKCPCYEEGPLPPSRGIVTVCNDRGVSHDLTTLRKWIRLNSRIFKTDRIDLRVTEREAGFWKDLSEFARADRVRLSLRMPDTIPPRAVKCILDAGAHDVCIEHAGGDNALLADWLAMLSERGLNARVIFLGTPDLPGRIDAIIRAMRGAKAVTVAAFDPFFNGPCAQNSTESKAVILAMNDLVARLCDEGVDACLYGIPFCHVDENNLGRAMNSAQYYLDHSGYQRGSFLFATRMYRFASCRVSMAIENLLSRNTNIHNAIDNALFPWIEGYPRFFYRIWIYHKLTRHLLFLKPRPRPLPENPDAYAHELKCYRDRQQKADGPVCCACRYKCACDRNTSSFRERFPGVAVNALQGKPIPVAVGPEQMRKRYYDDLDEARRRLPERLSKLAEKTQRMLLRTSPTREISPDSYEIVGRYTHHMPGAVRWLSFVKGELESTVLARVEPPLTLSFTVGGGIATHAGFSFGRHAKITCPLVDYSHRLTLTVDEEGYYVLLRDGKIVKPTEFEFADHVPGRLGGIMEPRLSLHNIDGMILTQGVSLWEGPRPLLETAGRVKYSVIIINTRYARRLQAALLALAHQQGIPPQLFEVVIAYVPGIDATDDLIDTIKSAYPDLRVVPFPVAEGHAHSKGFMINEAVKVVSGEWILLMDADILLPPDMFAALESIKETCHLIAPEGRKMLPPDVTAKVLLNELKPWQEYDEMLRGPGELRTREAVSIPIGFFQCVRRDILTRIPYHELNHFEASDWHFGREVTTEYGPEYRMKNVYVLHLDHGGSQWYGTQKHR